jgi:hypothetical protein
MSFRLKNGAVFLHIPKTGGTWVASLLERLDLVDRPLEPHGDFERLFWNGRFHPDGKVFRNLLRRRLGLLPPPIDPACFKFCFVREPLGWYVSWWRYMEGMNWRTWGSETDPYLWSPLAMLNGLGSPDFNTFVENVNRKRPGFVTELFGRFARPSVDFIGRQENLRDDFLAALHLSGLKPDPAIVENFPRLNEASGRVPFPDWDPCVWRRTLHFEYAAYARYGYAIPDEPGAPVRYEDAIIPVAARA